MKVKVWLWTIMPALMRPGTNPGSLARVGLSLDAR